MALPTPDARVWTRLTLLPQLLMLPTLSAVLIGFYVVPAAAAALYYTGR